MSSLKRQVAICTIGTILEWFDFSLFAALTPILSEIFFPHNNHVTALISTLLVFASGFIARPVGAIFFGHLGDKYGRKSTLLISIFVMAISTTGIGLIPTGLTISTALLVICRLTQGFAASGEFPGGLTLLAEQKQNKRKGLVSSFGTFASVAGIFLGTITCLLISKSLTHTTMLAWGWRIPFLLGTPIGILGYYLRRTLLESDEYNAAKQNNLIFNTPLLHLLKNYYPELIALLCMFIFTNTTLYINFVYFSSYSVSVHKFSINQAMLLNSLTIFVYGIMVLFFGLLSDYYNRKKLMVTACMLMIILIYPLFHLILHGTFITQLLAQTVISIIVGMFAGPLAIRSAHYFPVPVRFSGISLALNFAASLFGGTAPLICAWLIKISNNAIAPIYCFIFSALLALIAIYALKPVHGIEKIS